MAKLCKACGATILFIRTPAGKSMPVDFEPVPYWQKAGTREKIVTTNGEVLSCELEGDLNTATGLGFRPHWATCPHADSFRRRK